MKLIKYLFGKSEDQHIHNHLHVHIDGRLELINQQQPSGLNQQLEQRNIQSITHKTSSHEIIPDIINIIEPVVSFGEEKKPS